MLVDQRPISTDKRRVLEKPLSPRSVIRSIVDPATSHNPKSATLHRGTVMVSERMHAGTLKARIEGASIVSFDETGLHHVPEVQAVA
eukprot:1067698-Amphidinium_carterae.1